MMIRDFAAEDYPALADIHNAIFPAQPIVAEDFVDGDKRRTPRCKRRRWVAVEDGQVIGFSMYDQIPWNYAPDKYEIQVRVLPACRGRGVGSALYDALVAGLQPLNPRLLRTRAREDMPEAMRFAGRRGFKAYMRDSQSILDVAAFDPAPYAGLEDALREKWGVEIKTRRELEAIDPDCYRKLYEMERTIQPDVPGSDGEYIDYAAYIKETVETPMVLPDGFFVAVHDGEYIGLSTLYATRASDMLDIGFTGVMREWRRKGIATAMKVRGIAFARANGNSKILTDNASDNPMFQLNLALGFVPQPEWILYEKEVNDA